MAGERLNVSIGEDVHCTIQLIIGSAGSDGWEAEILDLLTADRWASGPVVLEVLDGGLVRQRATATAVASPGGTVRLVAGTGFSWTTVPGL